MSQHSVMLDSFQHSIPRFGNTAKNGIDVLGTKKHTTLIAPAMPIKREITPIGTAGFDKEIVFKMPSSGYLHHIQIKFLLAQTTTENYSDYPAMSSIKEVELRSDNETLHQYQYPIVSQYYLSKLKSEEARDKMLLATGGTNVGTSAAFYCLAPVPLFFDPIMNEGAAPLNLSKFKKAPELKITTRTLANSVKPTSTGGVITAIWAVFWISETSPSLKNLHKIQPNSFHKSIDFYTNTNNTIVTATATDVDISGSKGMNKKLFINLRLSSDIDTNKQYFINKEIDYIKTIFDGHEEWVFKQKEEGEVDYIMYNHGSGYSSTLGYPYIVPYGYFAAPGYGSVHTGGVHSAKVHKHEVRIYHSQGADCIVDFLSIRNAIYKYTNGQMVRLL